ncbi:MAG TPA: chloride channel protein [Solirubrobacteraceae bacterium]
MSEAPPDPQALLRSREYLKLLALAALIGVPVSAIAYGFLKLVAELQHWLYVSLPKDLGLDAAPWWWPAPLLVLGGLLVALAIQRLPGTGGHSPADGFAAGGALPPIELPGVACAALATLSFGAVLGPEAPLIAIGSGLGVLAVQLAARGAPQRAAAIIAAAGSFAAIAALVGSPLIGAVLLLEATGLGGPMLILVLLPGLLAAGIGDLIFLGLDSLTGFGTFSLTIPGLPPFDHITVADFLYALLIGGAAPFVGQGGRRLAIALRARVEPRMTLLTPLVGLAVAGLAILFHAITGKDVSMVLFSGQDQLPELLQQGAGWSAAVLVAVVAFKSLAYALSLSCFRGGPIFPAVFIGAAGGLAASHLPGLDMVPAVAMGVGAMSCTMLNLPISSVLLATLLLGKDGVQVMPVVIVAVAVAYIVTARLTPLPAKAATAAPPAARPTPV